MTCKFFPTPRHSGPEARNKDPDDHIVVSEGSFRPFPKLPSAWGLVETVMTFTNSLVWSHSHSGLCGTFLPLCLSCQIASDMDECCLCGASVAMRTMYRTRYGIPVSHQRVHWEVVAQIPKGFPSAWRISMTAPPHLHISTQSFLHYRPKFLSDLQEQCSYVYFGIY